MTSQEFKDHGELVAKREIQVNHQPYMERMVLYCKEGVFTDGCRLYRTRPNAPEPPYWMIVAPMEEPPIYLVIGYQEAEAIGEALAPRPAATERHLEDAMDVCDRLLTMMERQNVYDTTPPIMPPPPQFTERGIPQ